MVVMKKILFVTVSAAAALFCGCQHTRVDQVQPSEGMQDWYKDIRDNYPGFQPPALVSPGVSGYTAPKAEKKNSVGQYPAMDNGIEAVPVDPVSGQDKSAEVEVEVKPAAKAEVKPEVNPAAKAEVKPAAAEIEPPDPTNSEISVVQSGDTLGAISKKFYGSARHAALIRKANSDIVSNANKLKPGMKLIIPKL